MQYNVMCRSIQVVFIIYTHYRDDKVLAVSSLNSDPVVSQSAELMLQGRMPTGTQLK